MVALIGDLIVKAALLFGLLVLSAGAGVATHGGINLVRDIIQPTPSPKPTLIEESWIVPTPKSTPKPAVKSGETIKLPTLTPDPDPVVNCQFTYLPWRKMRRSECSKSFECQIGGQWYIYTSRDKCKQDQSTYWSNYYKGNYYVPNYTFPTYTYTPAPLPTYQPYQPLPTPTLSEEELQIIIDQLERDIKYCKNEVNSRYNDLVRSCNRFAGTSGFEVCERAYNKEREKELQKCEGY